MRTTVPLTAKPVQYITIPTLANNHAPDIWARWHSISHVVTAKWKYGGSNMTRTVYRSWAHWVQLDTQSDFPHRWHKQLVTNAFLGTGTYTVWVSSCGLSACSGNTGCGGSPMGTQPRDLLIAWLSFLAGDFCEEGRAHKQSAVMSSCGNSRKQFWVLLRESFT